MFEICLTYRVLKGKRRLEREVVGDGGRGGGDGGTGGCRNPPAAHSGIGTTRSRRKTSEHRILHEPVGSITFPRTSSLPSLLTQKQLAMDKKARYARTEILRCAPILDNPIRDLVFCRLRQLESLLAHSQPSHIASFRPSWPPFSKAWPMMQDVVDTRFLMQYISYTMHGISSNILTAQT